MNAVHLRRRAAALPWDAGSGAPPALRTPTVFGWHESSHELSRGLEVIEHPPADSAPGAEPEPVPPGG